MLLLLLAWFIPYGKAAAFWFIITSHHVQMPKKSLHRQSSQKKPTKKQHSTRLLTPTSATVFLLTLHEWPEHVALPKHNLPSQVLLPFKRVFKHLKPEMLLKPLNVHKNQQESGSSFFIWRVSLDTLAITAFCSSKYKTRLEKSRMLSRHYYALYKPHLTVALSQ